MTKYPNWAHGILAFSFFSPTPLIDFASFRLSREPGTHIAHACLLDATHSAASQTFWYILSLRTARNMERTYKSPSLATLLAASSVVPHLLM
jgi:hypothetical protein